MTRIIIFIGVKPHEGKFYKHFEKLFKKLQALESHKYHPPKYTMAFQHLQNYFYMDGDDVQVTIKSDLDSNVNSNYYSGVLKPINEHNLTKKTRDSAQFDEFSMRDAVTDKVQHFINHPETYAKRKSLNSRNSDSIRLSSQNRKSRYVFMT